MYKLLILLLLHKKIEKKEINEKNLKKIKGILDNFYFIGLSENKEDYELLYNILNIKKKFPNQNISKKFTYPKDKVHLKIRNQNLKFDNILYDHAKNLNNSLKKSLQ